MFSQLRHKLNITKLKFDNVADLEEIDSADVPELPQFNRKSSILKVSINECNLDKKTVQKSSRNLQENPLISAYSRNPKSNYSLFSIEDQENIPKEENNQTKCTSSLNPEPISKVDILPVLSSFSANSPFTSHSKCSPHSADSIQEKESDESWDDYNRDDECKSKDKVADCCSDKENNTIADAYDLDKNQYISESFDNELDQTPEFVYSKIRHNRVQIVRNALERGFDATYTDGNGNTMMHIAVRLLFYVSFLCQSHSIIPSRLRTT